MGKKAKHIRENFGAFLNNERAFRFIFHYILNGKAASIELGTVAGRPKAIGFNINYYKIAYFYII